MAYDFTALDKALEQIEIVHQEAKPWDKSNAYAVQQAERAPGLFPAARAAALGDKDLEHAISELQASTDAKLEQLKGKRPSGSVPAERFAADLAKFRKELERAAATKP